MRLLPVLALLTACTGDDAKPMPEGEDEFSRPVEVYVPEGEYDRAYQLFFGDSENEI